MSFAHLATLGTLTYNGYTFDGSSQIEVSVEFVQDDAQRTVIYHKHTIKVHFFVNDSADLDGDVLALRARLSKQGGPLRFVNHGFGDDLIVNVSAGGLRDVKWGPTPRVLHWSPVGGSQTCEVIWEVETCVPVCSTSPQHRSTGVMAMNYGVSFSISDGYTTRSIDGYLEIAQTRLLGRPPDVADRYRHLINPFLPDGFERTTSWSIDQDKSRLNFAITDKQIRSQNAYPPGVVKIEGDHTVAWVKGGAGTAYQRNSLSLDVELAQGASPTLAWNIFGTIVRQRTDHAARRGRKAFLESVTASEDLFGARQSFAASWRVLMNPGTAANSPGNTPPPTLGPGLFDFSASGLWQPLGTEWRLWKTSMFNLGIFQNRGVTGLEQLAANDAIVDLCSSHATLPFNGQNPPQRRPRPGRAPTIFNQRPTPRESYLDFNMTLHFDSQRPTARQSSLQAPNPQSQPTSMQGTGEAVIGNQGQAREDTIQGSGASQFFVTLIGYAKRAGWAIEKPALLTVGGRIATEVDAKFALGPVVNVFGCPVYRAWWIIRYALAASPGIVRPQPTLTSP